MESYDRMAKYYAGFVDTKAYNAYYERPAMLSLMPDVNEKKALDAGCAGGWYTEWLLNHGAEVTALDFNETMIEITRERTGNRAALFRADLNNPLPFLENESMDLIVASLVLHYLKDWTTALGEFFRILKKNGRLLFSVHHPFADYLLFNRENYFTTELITDTWSMGEESIEVEFFARPLNRVLQPVADAGFTIETVAEPFPTEDFKKSSSEAYERLLKKPQFLFISAAKKSC
ncbi:class I SAM-dependent methyltransferase [Brucepastera parasyntrophica]|uniref:class I SAM-dependent methyltransferase n=1 Tax=Brucepastera parasyntrophica TaxID=2880008 RepID=UPI00210861D2|nr:class I SAM-dependent methyltransferase [Brucepastera parasyntrophica]ULQ59490.1 class I SAM-dependent methyltransferase [Brucepastera parasyntrophica]